MNTPHFWRDERLPFIEARSIENSQKLAYDEHSHDTFSIGAITHGANFYQNSSVQYEVNTGSVVIINPHDVHACKSVAGAPWSYLMLFVDTTWMTRLQNDWGIHERTQFQRFNTHLSTDARLFQALVDFHALLVDDDQDILCKEIACVEFFGLLNHLLHEHLSTSAPLPNIAHQRLKDAAHFIATHCTESLRLADICASAHLSPSYLVRAFKAHFGLTPHAYLLNQRILLAQKLLKQGKASIDIAHELGFADQAHFQRVFKRKVAATPRQYAML